MAVIDYFEVALQKKNFSFKWKVRVLEKKRKRDVSFSAVLEELGVGDRNLKVQVDGASSPEKAVQTFLDHCPTTGYIPTQYRTHNTLGEFGEWIDLDYQEKDFLQKLKDKYETEKKQKKGKK